MDVSSLSVPVDLLTPVKAPPVASGATRAKIDATAKSFESQFLSVMIGQMFEGTEISAPFGGGEGEQAFKSFLTDAMAKSMTRNGGIGLAKDISKEMLKMQGLS
jgi:flagellar protein FlgJ